MRLGIGTQAGGRQRLVNGRNRVLVAGALGLLFGDGDLVARLVARDGYAFVPEDAFVSPGFLLFFIDADVGLDVFVAGPIDALGRRGIVLGLLGQLAVLFATENGKIVKDLGFLVLRVGVAALRALIILGIRRVRSHDRVLCLQNFQWDHTSDSPAMPIDGQRL
ncbi:MAG: hypothetical protein OEL88_13355 [Sterolibacteriaceae bacterium MAG5]|nr:hypothetical protein [Candidatus Nitricoxidireducens bremensis]